MWKLSIDIDAPRQDTALIELEFNFDERGHGLAFMLDVIEHGLRQEKEDGSLTLYPPVAIERFVLERSAPESP